MNSEGDDRIRPAQRVTVAEGNDGQRIDNFLRTQLKGIPKSHIYRILRRGEVRVNKGRIRQDYRLKLGDVVRIPPLRRGDERPPTVTGSRTLARIERSIIHEDPALLVLNKPSGMAVHGGSGIRFGVIEALRTLRPGAPFLELVHRLDRETSGCLVVAKKRSALRRLHALLRENSVQKGYLALLMGPKEREARRVEVPLRKNVLRSGERVVRAVDDGKVAMTVFEPLSVRGLASLVRARPTTGRTHQIRVHAAHMGHPVAGDEKYGDPAFNRRMKDLGLRRLFLHAELLEFSHPDTGESLRFQAPLGRDLVSVLERIDLGNRADV